MLVPERLMELNTTGFQRTSGGVLSPYGILYIPIGSEELCLSRTTLEEPSQKMTMMSLLKPEVRVYALHLFLSLSNNCSVSPL